MKVEVKVDSASKEIQTWMISYFSQGSGQTTTVFYHNLEAVNEQVEYLKCISSVRDIYVARVEAVHSRNRGDHAKWHKRKLPFIKGVTIE